LVENTFSDNFHLTTFHSLNQAILNFVSISDRVW